MGLHDRLHRQNGTSNGHGPEALDALAGQGPEPVERRPDPYGDLKGRIHHACIAKLGPQLYSAGKSEDGAPDDLAEKVLRVVTEQLALDRTPLTREERRQVTREITDDILGYGPLEPLLRDDSVTEVMVNKHDRVYVERKGKIEVADAAFVDNAHLLRIIDKIVSQVGRRVDEASPMVDARLPDGSRVNAIIPPLSLRGPTLTIRKFSRDPYTMDDLIQFGTTTPEAAQFLSACVRGKLNVLISGGTGTGKTTTLNALSAYVPNDERIVTIEDAAELQLQQEHVITLEARPPNIEGEGEIRIRELVRNALRMRPDRIIVGEVRGPETLDMLQAMNTGHEGSLTTIHANTPRDALSRLETLVLTAGVELPHRAIREQIASAFDLLVQIARLVDGSRRITHITEVLRMESDVITLQDVYVAKPPDEESAAAGAGKPVQLLAELECTGLKPHFLEKMAANGVILPPNVLQRRELVPAELRGRELRRVRVSRRALIRILLLSTVVALMAPVAASASVTLRRVDVSGYPTIRATLVAPVASDQPPTLTEDGRRVVDLTAQNLSTSKSVVIAVDRSQSMAGKQLEDATAAAREFLAAKASSDRVAVVVFGSKAVQLTRFASSTIDADDALRTMAVDSASGTALNDAVALSTSILAKEPGRARVVVLLTDGQDVSSKTTLDEAIAGAHKAGTLVYPISIGASDKTKQPLQKLAHETGGSFNSAASSKALSEVYSSVAAELKRTWRIEYVTAARPGEQLHLRLSLPPEGAVATDLTIPGTFDAPSGSSGLPSPLYSPIGGLLLTMLVAFLVLTACGFLLTSGKGSWVKSRLSPHVDGGPRKSRQKKKGERLAAFAGLFRATEQAFGHRRIWMKLQRLLERADVPLRTVEFAYIIVGSAFVLAFFAVLMGRSSFGILIAFAIGGSLPYLWVSIKAKRRMNAFENQLPDLLVTLAASLKAGHSFKQGIQTVVDEGQEPASKELARVITDTRLGRPMDEALGETAERIGSKNFSFVITAVTIQRQVGGSLAGLFDMVADTVRQRQQFARKIKGLTAMGRASAYVLIGLPFFVAFALTLLNPSYMDPLYHTTTGRHMIMGGLLMMGFGSLILRKLVSFRG